MSNVSTDSNASQFLLEKVLQYGVLTGSQAFGAANSNSDYDVIYPLPAESYILEMIGDRTKIESNYFKGYQVMDDKDRWINLIPLSIHDFFPWILATKALAASLKDSQIADKVKRHGVFMGMVSLFKVATTDVDRERVYKFGLT